MIMKKYKLIKEFPGSPELGTVVEKEDSSFFINTHYGFRVRQSEIENFPEFWEEIKSEYPKILSFKSTFNGGFDGFICELKPNGNYNALVSGGIGSEGCSLHSMLHKGCCVDSGHFKIYQVQTSESDIWTVGDKIENPFPNNPIVKAYDTTIKRFVLHPNGNFTVWVVAGNDISQVSIGINELLKKAKPFLFTTEDGVDIFEGDTSVMLPKNKLSSSEITCSEKYKGGQRNIYLYFSTKEAAEKYIDENKPKFSKKQIKEIFAQLSSGYSITTSFLKECKAKLGI
jgi:hypothetical protein